MSKSFLSNKLVLLLISVGQIDWRAEKAVDNVRGEETDYEAWREDSDHEVDQVADNVHRKGKGGPAEAGPDDLQTEERLWRK